MRILVATDLSANARRAALRAGLLGRALGARSAILLHVAPRFPLPRAIQTRAARALRAQLRRLAGELRRETGLAFEPRLARGPVVGELLRASARADLVVVGARGRHPLRDFAIGTSAERLLRECRRPVLVVKRKPAGAYRSALVPVDFSADAQAAAVLAAQLAPEAELCLLHAFEVPFEGKLRFAGVEEDRIQHYRRQARERARTDMGALVAALGASGARATCAIAHGYPPTLITRARRATGADLVAVGKHGRSALADLLFGSVALHALATSDCDVLVVPPGDR